MAVRFLNGLTSSNSTDRPDIVSNIPFVRKHDNSGDYLSSIDSLESFILSKIDGGYGGGTKPSGSHNGLGIISLQTHTTNYFTQLALDTNQNALWIRSANGAASFGSWEQLASRNWVSSQGYLTSITDHNHDTLYDSLGSAAAVGQQVNERIDTEVFDAIGAAQSTADAALPKAGGILTGQVIFPSAATTKPVLPNGFISRNDSNDTTGRHDIWGISERYYPSNTTAGDAWGIQWSGTPNDIVFVGGGEDKVTISLDEGNITTLGSVTANGGNSSQWNTAYGWGNHASAGYLTIGQDVPSQSSWGDATKFYSEGDIAFSGAGNHSLQVVAENGNDAFMAFHIHGDHAVYLGLENGTNRLYTGGWSLGAAKYQIWDSRDFNPSDFASTESVAAVDARINEEVIPYVDAVAGDAAKGVTAYGWGDHAGAGYLTSVPSSIAVTSIGVGGGVTLTESTDRADLLYINSSTSGWGGLQIGNTSNEFIFSLMGNGNAGGIYDDQNGDWIIYWDENSGVQLYHNSNTKLFTVSDGVNVTGRLYASSGIEVPYGDGEHRPMVVLNGATNYGLFHTEATSDLFTFDFNGDQRFRFGQNGSLAFGTPGNGSNTGGCFVSIEGNADTSGEGSGRMFFREHNSTTAAMDNYGMSIGYRGGATSVTTAGGNTWDGLAQIGNGAWGMWGHNNDATGALIMYGDRAATYVNFAGNDVQGVNDLYVADQIIHTGDTNTYMQFHANDEWRVVTAGTERLQVKGSDVYVNTDFKVSGSYTEIGNGIGSVSNDGNWNARLNVAGSSHARLDVKSVSDGIITTMYAHTGNAMGKVGTMSNHALGLMTAGSEKVILDAGGNMLPVTDRTQWLGLDTNRWQIVFCEILDSAGQHEKNLQNPEGEKSVGEYQTGTVLVWKGGKNIPCTEYADHMRMGIAVEGIDSPLIQGAEPVLVTGPVNEGDYLVTSRKEGHAEAMSPEVMRQQNLFDCVIGKALESGDGESYLIKTWINI